MPYMMQGDTVHYRNSDGTAGAIVPGGAHNSHVEAVSHLRALEANVSDAKEKAMSETEKTLNTGDAGSAGFAVNPDDKAPLQTADTKYAKDDEVLVKSLNAPGIIVSLARQKSGGVIYRVTLKSGGIAVCAADDLVYAGKARVKEDAKKTPNTPRVADYVNKRMLGLAIYIRKMLMDTPPNKFTLSIVLNDINDLQTLWQKLRTGARGENVVDERLRAAMTIFRQIHLNTPDKERRVLASLLSHRLNEAARVVREIVLSRTRVASTKEDAPVPLWQKTKEAVLHDALTEVQATLADGQPVAVSGITVTDPENIRIADKCMQIKAGDDWKALSDEETDALCVRFECLSPSMHRSMVKMACQKGEDVPADVLVDYPDISQQQVEVKSIKSATALTKTLIKALGLRYKRKSFPALLENDVIKQMPDRCQKAARAIRNARRSGMLSGETEKTLRRMKAQEGCRLIAKIATLSVKQADLPAFLNAKYAPRGVNAGQEMGK